MDYELCGHSPCARNSTVRLHAGREGAGDDPRMMFSWYSGDYTTDLALIDAKPERRANPSMASWGAVVISRNNSDGCRRTSFVDFI